MLVYFNDYKTYHLLKYEANIKNKRINEVIIDALKMYIEKETKKTIDKFPVSKINAWKLIKNESEVAGCTVADFIERAVIEYCGLNVQFINRHPDKKGSFFDLNRDAKK